MAVTQPHANKTISTLLLALTRRDAAGDFVLIYLLVILQMFEHLRLSSKIYTRPELLAMKWADRQQGKDEGDGDWYRGGFDDDGKWHGLCRGDYDDGMYYIGEHNHDRQCGHWIGYNKDGSIYHERDM